MISFTVVKAAVHRSTGKKRDKRGEIKDAERTVVKAGGETAKEKEITF